jgi:hypothetical protein
LEAALLEILTAAQDKSLLTIEEWRAAVGVSDNSRDEDVQRLADAVDIAILNECRIEGVGATPPTLRLETVKEIFRIGGKRVMLPLARRPIVAVESVMVGTTALTAADYEVDQTILFRLCGDFRSVWECAKVTVVYQAGWDVVPGDLKLAARKLAQMAWSEDGRDPNLKRVRVEGISEREYWVPPSSDPLFPTDVVDLLSSYRNGPRIG